MNEYHPASNLSWPTSSSSGGSGNTLCFYTAEFRIRSNSVVQFGPSHVTPGHSLRGRPKKGREESQNERGREKVQLLFLCSFRPPDERKIPDWSDLMNYLIHPSDWSATCHSNH